MKYEVVYHENELNDTRVIARHHVVISHPLSKDDAKAMIANIKSSKIIYRPELGDRLTIRKTSKDNYLNIITKEVR